MLSTEQLEVLLEKEDLRPDDLKDLKISSSHKSSVSGLTHIYLQQHFENIPINGAVASLHIDEREKIVHFTNSLVGNISKKINKTTPTLTKTKATESVLAFIQKKLREENTGGGFIKNNKEQVNTSTSDMIASAKLIFEVIDDDNLRLSWNFETFIHHQKYSVSVDTETGAILKNRNYTLSCAFEHQELSHECASHPANRFPKPLKTNTEEVPLFRGLRGAKTPKASAFLKTTAAFPGQYNIFPRTTESPLYGGRSLKTGCDLVDAVASPHGWHDSDGDVNTIEYDYTRSNNVYAFYAEQGTAAEPDPEKITRVALTGTYAFGNVPIPASSSLNFNYTNSLVSLDAKDFLEDAVTNLFVMNNICHDVFFHYGFTESAGNFQETNYTGTGTGGDEILARAQDEDGAILNTATFSPTAEGASPSMRIHLWTTDTPNEKAGDFDNLVITHEYGHGVSFRLVGGPNNINCLSNFEQGGEGWSDFFGLLMTMKDHNGNGTIDKDVLGEGIRGVGTYLLNQGANERGFRPEYYNFEMDENIANANGLTYGQVNSLAFPHGVGFLWCTMLWDMTMELIEIHGFHENIYDSNNNAGNIRAMKIVMEALKMTPCEPSFVDMRNAIISANNTLYGNGDETLLWEVFSRRGLGFNAAAGGNENFDMPTLSISKTVDKAEAQTGDQITYTITAKNDAPVSLTNVVITDDYSAALTVNSISNNGSASGNTITWPAVSLAKGASITRTFTSTITATDGTETIYDEPIEFNAPPGFVSLGSWLVSEGYANPNSSSTKFWYQSNPASASESSLVLNLDFSSITYDKKFLSFWHYLNMEPTLDGGVVEVFNNGAWEDLGPKMIQNGYNSFILDALPTPIGVPVPTSSLSGQKAFSGYSDYIQTIIDLSDFGDVLQVRFRFSSSPSTNQNSCHNGFCEGWHLDDFKVFDLDHILNEACATSAQGHNNCGNIGQVGTIYFAGALPVELLNFSATPDRDKIILNWQTASETNNKGFFLQRRTANSSFKNIVWIDGQGNSFDITDYQFLDENVEFNERYFYRLQQVDLTGETTFSKIVDAILLEDVLPDFHFYPNPVKDILTIEFNNLNNDSKTIEIINVQGQILKQYQLSANEFQLIIDTSQLPSEIYFLKTKTKRQIITKRFFKK